MSNDLDPCSSINVTCVYTTPSSILQPSAGFPDPQVSIYVGGMQSPTQFIQLQECKCIGKILNVAYDVDDQPQNDPYNNTPIPNNPNSDPSHYNQLFAKVGLIDGYGNIPNQMAVIAAVYMAEQLLTFPTGAIREGGEQVCPSLANPYPPASVEPDQQRNLLIHCHDGGSRSVTVAALYIWYKFGVQLKDPSLKSFSDVYNMVKNLRGKSTNPITDQNISNYQGGPSLPLSDQGLPLNITNLTEPPPTFGMQKAAFAIVDTYATLFPALTFKESSR